MYTPRLLNPSKDEAEGVRIVAGCYQAAEDKKRDVENLFLSQRSSLGWRARLVGCVALLVAERNDGPLDALIKAACNCSWVSPQILVTASLAVPPVLQSRVEASILEREDAKAAAALVFLRPELSPGLIALASGDLARGDALAEGWRKSITSALDAAGIRRTW